MLQSSASVSRWLIWMISGRNASYKFVQRLSNVSLQSETTHQHQQPLHLTHTPSMWENSKSTSLALSFNRHFLGEPGLAGVCWSKGWLKWWVVTTGAISRPKLQSNHHQQTNMQFFTGWMPFLSPNQQWQSTEWKNITFHGLAYPKLTWGSSNFVLNH